MVRKRVSVAGQWLTLPGRRILLSVTVRLGLLALVSATGLLSGCRNPSSMSSDVVSESSGFHKAGAAAQASIRLLNVSYDPTRELYRDINAVFAKQWLAKTGQRVTIEQSHGGSATQARAVADGLEADVVTLGLAYDIDSIAKAGLIRPGWATRLPHHSTPFTSTILFLVRNGNPKRIKDWDDLVKPGVSVIAPNPKTSGGARWIYLAAYGHALREFHGNQAAARDFVRKLYLNVPVLDTGARGSTITFTQHGQGDVLLTWENEALLVLNHQGINHYSIVAPSESILAEPPVAVVDQVVDRRHTRKLATSYLQFLFSEQGQKIGALHYYRPQIPLPRRYTAPFARIRLFTVDEMFGGWAQAQKTHFANGGVFDMIRGSDPG